MLVRAACCEVGLRNLDKALSWELSQALVSGQTGWAVADVVLFALFVALGSFLVVLVGRHESIALFSDSNALCLTALSDVAHEVVLVNLQSGRSIGTPVVGIVDVRVVFLNGKQFPIRLNI